MIFHWDDQNLAHIARHSAAVAVMASLVGQGMGVAGRGSDALETKGFRVRNGRLIQGK